MSSTDTIRIDGITAFGYHGVLPQEREKGQRFVVDIELTVDVRGAGESDDLTQTVDYSWVAEKAVAVLVGDPLNLIETVADRIARAVLVDERVQVVAVTVHKPEAPIAADFADVSVRVVRSR